MGIRTPPKPNRPKPTMPPTWSQHGKSQPDKAKVASHKKNQTLNPKSNPKRKKPRVKVATFASREVAT
ncbi:MAG: hypothetical protein ABSG33_00180 [Candidatus Bathyarchaeia archaeon]